MSRPQLLYAREYAALVRDAEEMDILADRVQIDGGRHTRICQQSLHFRREQERLPVRIVVDRFDSNSVSRDQERLASSIPNREGEHALDLVEKCFSKRLIEAKD